MSKRKPIFLNGERVQSGPFGPPIDPMVQLVTKCEWIGPNMPGEFLGYIRLETNGKYIGSFYGRDLRRVKKWLDQYFAEAE